MESSSCSDSPLIITYNDTGKEVSIPKFDADNQLDDNNKNEEEKKELTPNQKKKLKKKLAKAKKNED